MGQQAAGVGDLPPYESAPFFEIPLPPRRPWWHARKRDLVGVIAAVCAVLAVVVYDAGGPGQVLLIGPFYDTQILLLLALAALLLGGVWIISRAWLNASHRGRLSTIASSLLTVGVLAAGMFFGFWMLIGLLLSTDSSYEKFSAPGSTEQFVLKTSSLDGYPSYTVFRGGPWKFDMLYPIGTHSDQFGTEYDSRSLILVYPTAGGTDDCPNRLSTASVPDLETLSRYQ